MQFNGAKHLKIRCTIVEKKFTKLNILFDGKMRKITKNLKLTLANLKYTKKWRKMYAMSFNFSSHYFFTLW